MYKLGVDKDSATSELKYFLKKNIDIQCSLENLSGHLRSRRKIQHLMFLKHTDPQVQKLFELLMSHALKAEKLTPNSGMVFLNLFLNDSLDDEEKSPIRTKKDLQGLLLDLKMENFVYQILDQCLDLVDANSKISIRKSTGQKTYVEKTDGYKFLVKSLLRSVTLTMKSCKVLCVDGYIENVSEIHHLLSDLSEKKSPCLFFVRGMSEDVLHTIKVNNDRKTMNVVPFVVPFDTENVNTIVDIAVVTGTDVISSLKGELISSCRYEKLGDCQECIIDAGNILLKNSQTVERVNAHLASLKLQMEDRKDIEEILGKRVQSLTSSCVDIHLSDDFSYFHRSSQFDEGIRVISSVLNNTYAPEKVAKDMFKSFQRIDRDVSLFTVT